MKDNKYSYTLLEAFEDLDKEELLKEARSSEEIRAEIDRLQQELEQALVAEKKSSYNGNTPKVVYIWDIYLNLSDRGNWTSADYSNNKWEGTVFETEDEALDAAYSHLRELEDEGELEEEVDDYYIDTISVPVKDVHLDTLSFSGLNYLI